MKGRIIYIQYTNPAAYPPLQHSSRILADEGYRVTFLGTASHGFGTLEFPPHRCIRVRRWRWRSPGVVQKLHYAAFSIWCLLVAIIDRANWIYASDPLSSPIALLLHHLGFRVVYHEHDAPAGESDRDLSFLAKLLCRTRGRLARCADICVLPNRVRLEAFKNSTGRRLPTFSVWNCPARKEIRRHLRRESNTFVLYYHGNISSDLVPLTLVRAVASLPQVTLRIVGYTTVGHDSYRTALLLEAQNCEASDRITIDSPMQRFQLLEAATKADVGWCAMPIRSANHNFQAMVGASNKAFDYMACGLALLVSDTEEWRGTYRDYSLTCIPDDADTIAEALEWFTSHRSETREMGRRAQLRVKAEWNYESQFNPVKMRICSKQ